MVVTLMPSVGTLTDQNLTLVREQGGIVAVLNAMDTHPENEALQAEGCWALLVFCSNQGIEETRIDFVALCSGLTSYECSCLCR